MAAIDMDNLSPAPDRKVERGYRRPSLPNLAHVSAVIIALCLISVSLVYFTVTALQAQQRALVTELRAEISGLRTRVDRLEESCAQRGQEQNGRHHSGYQGDEMPTGLDDEDDNEEAGEDFVVINTDERREPSPFAVNLFSAVRPGNVDMETSSGFEAQDTEKEDGGESSRALGVASSALEPFNGNRHEENPRNDDDDNDAKLSTNRIHGSGDAPADVGPIGEDRHRRQAQNRESRNRSRELKGAKGKQSKAGGKRDRGTKGAKDRNKSNQRHQGGGETGQRSRCHRMHECLPQPAYAHFEGDIVSATLIDPDQIQPHGWTMVNIPGAFIPYWRYASWMQGEDMSDMRDKFRLQTRGKVNVTEPGVYFVYSQVQYNDDRRISGHAISVNGLIRFKCAECPVDSERRVSTCYAGGLAYLHPNSVVGIRVAYPNSVINMHHESTYFGLYKVA